ncbi:MAG TPA: UDP-N-acetylglucosamine 1-carboxyvinyltransferase [Saprospiraceae bacterium]|nr:UDP-N-acetylglucosamine 1-carboxyvinyltransferase [Saprospiraceae bacterium]
MITDAFEVQGNCQLKGTLVPQGAKNEALQILCAVLLTREKVTVSNIPGILDVTRLIELLGGLGVKVEKLAEGTYAFTAADLDREYMASDEFDKKAKAIRGSVMLIGPLLARLGKMYLPKPGGDKIGRRRLDTHFEGLTQLGAKVEYDPAKAQYFIEAKNLNGAYIHMEEISVTGTANVVMAAVLAQGTTTVYNAACEPYVQQLCRMLVRMGARIEGIGSNLLTITGVPVLKGTEHRMLPDMIEVGSFIGLAAMTRSEITIQQAGIQNLGIIPNVFRKMGVTLIEKGDDLYIPALDEYEISTFMDGSILTVYDSPWPGFTPDLMSVILVMAIQSKGSVLIHQKMFESRLFFVDKLIEMGAQIILCDPHRATVIGLNRKHFLRGIEMSSPDIRAGVALLLAALSAKGTSLIHNVNQIDRGYQNIDGRLNAIGARIRRL